MSIEIDSLITAYDIKNKNIFIVTKKDRQKASKTIKDDSEKWWFDSDWFQRISAPAQAEKGAIMVQLRGSSQYYIRFYSDITHDTVIFEWHGHDNAPDINTPGWVVEEKWYEDDWWFSIHLPKNTQTFFKIQYDDLALSSRPDSWGLEMRQAQTDILPGEKIRVWDTLWKELLPENTTVITAVLGNAGRLGAE